MFSAARAELLVLRKWRMAWALLLVTPVTMLAVSYIGQLLIYLTLTPAQYGTQGSPSQNLPMMFNIIAVFQFQYTAPVPLIVLGALMGGGDWDRGTLRTTLLQAPGRVRALGGQLIAIWAGATASTALTFAAAAGASLAVRTLESAAVVPGAGAWPLLLVSAESLGSALLVALAYSAIGLGLGTVCRSAAGAMSVALAFILLVDDPLQVMGIISGGVVRTISDLAPGPAAVTVTSLFGTPGGGAISQNYLPVSVPEAVWTLCGYAAAFLLLAVVLLRRRDIAPARARRDRRAAARRRRDTSPGTSAARAPAGLVATVRAELLILRRRPAVWALGLSVPAQMLIGYYLTQYVWYLHPDSPTGQTWGLNGPMLLAAMKPGQYLTGALSAFGTAYSPVYGVYGAGVLMLLGALIGGSDWGRGTIKAALTQGPGRLRTAFGQYSAVVAALAASVLATFAAAAAVSVIVALAAGASPGRLIAGLPAPGQFAAALAAGLAMSLAYGAVGLTLGVLLKSSSAGVGAVLVWAVVIDPAVQYISGQLHGLLYQLYLSLPDESVNTLSDLTNHTGLLLSNPLYPALVGPARAFATLGLYALVFLTVPALVTWRRDIL